MSQHRFTFWAQRVSFFTGQQDVVILVFGHLKSVGMRKQNKFAMTIATSTLAHPLQRKIPLIEVSLYAKNG
ncbi:hypothetical protein [Bacillus sp. SD088]|uniref:hypothetical protein n=1 Tax=Bacillus sp. SD088 TaxID=2782012 RepID=UPI001A973D0E|nr:hypothetical protein [Bacillus sp. SD088]MBO0992335.1 hypothetical protein [Bacillus sp. SD088]